MKLYYWAVKALIRFLVHWCARRGRYVHYVHTHERAFGSRHQVKYLTRYVLFGHMTGDPEPRGLRARLPNIYLHEIHRPDADDSLHNHPWPWGFAIGLLGGYDELRYVLGADHQLERILTRAWDEKREHRAPFFNWLSGRDFHRIDATLPHSSHGGQTCGRSVWTFFVAGPRAGNSGWGYLVPRRGFVHQKERHAEVGACEVRGGRV